jgi:hypothetical protein
MTFGKPAPSLPFDVVKTVHPAKVPVSKFPFVIVSARAGLQSRQPTTNSTTTTADTRRLIIELLQDRSDFIVQSLAMAIGADLFVFCGTTQGRAAILVKPPCW